MGVSKFPSSWSKEDNAPCLGDWEPESIKYMKKKLKFKSYFKYTFTFIDEQGVMYYNDGDANDIYRWDVEVENEAEQIDGIWYLDGVQLFEIRH